MPRPCSICTHDRRPEIDRALVAGAESAPQMAAKYRVSPDAVLRHKGHIPRRLVTAQDAQDVADADDLLGQVRTLQERAVTLLDKAERAGDYRTALAGIGQARGCLELLAKLLGELDERPVVNLLVAPEWLLVRSTLLEVLRPYPEPRALLSARLAALEANGAAGG
jgi:hypothetical protein